MDNGMQFEKDALTLEWTIPWMMLRESPQKWFVGGYSNVSVNVVDRHLKSRSRCTALVDHRGSDRRQLTYETLWDTSARLARWMDIKGFRAGTRIAIYGRSELESYVTLLACQRVGAVAVLCLPTPSDPLLADHLGQCEVALVFTTDAEATAQIRRLRRRGAYQGNHLLLGATEFGEDDYEHVLASCQGGIDAIPVEASRVSLLTYGDHPSPYGYSGLGILASLAPELTRWLGVRSDDEVMLVGDQGGLYHRLVLTCLLMSQGVPVIWSDRVAEPSCAAVVVTGFPGATVLSEEEATAVRWLCPTPTQAVWTTSRERGAVIHHRFGTLAPWDASIAPEPGPGADLHEKEWSVRLEDEFTHTAVGDQAVEFLRLHSLPSIAIESTQTHTLILFVVTDDPSEDLDHWIRDHWPSDSAPVEDIVVVHSHEWLQTSEGALAVDAIQAIVNQDVRIRLDYIKNPEVLEALQNETIRLGG